MFVSEITAFRSVNHIDSSVEVVDPSGRIVLKSCSVRISVTISTIFAKCLRDFTQFISVNAEVVP
jgi:hypothetical protein